MTSKFVIECDVCLKPMDLTDKGRGRSRKRHDHCSARHHGGPLLTPTAGDGVPDLPPRINKTCDREACGKPMTVKRSHFLRMKRTYCSPKCAQIDRSNHDTWVIQYCYYCGERFKRRRSEAKRPNIKSFCTRDHWKKHMAENKPTERELKNMRNQRRYERYWSDPEYREKVKESGRKAQRKRRNGTSIAS